MHTALLACAFAALTAVDVDAHGYVSSPRPRAQTINGHRYRYEPQSDGAFNADCWDAARGQFGGIQATYEAGQTITTTVVVTAFHQGWHQIRLCDDKQGRNNCLSQTLARPLTNVNNNNPTQSILRGLGTRNYQWELPANFTTDHGTMQWWWRTNNGGNEHFKSCHDIRVVPSGDSTIRFPDEVFAVDRVDYSHFCANRGGGDLSVNMPNLEACAAAVWANLECGDEFNYAPANGGCDCVPMGEVCELQSSFSYDVWKFLDLKTPSPTATPTPNPTATPTTADPTVTPTLSPTGSPTVSPTHVPTLSPTPPTPVPTPVPTASPTWTPACSTFLNNVQFTGPNLEVFASSNAGDCCDTCNQVDECVGFTFVPSNSGSWPTGCLLKTSLAQGPGNNMISGVKANNGGEPIPTAPPTPSPPTSTPPAPTNAPPSPTPAPPPPNCLADWQNCNAAPDDCCSGVCSGNQCRPA